MARRQRLHATVRSRVGTHLRRGHPWVYDRGILRGPNAEPGEVIVLEDDDGEIGFAYWDPQSPIRARQLPFAGDDDWARRVAARAGVLRKATVSASVNAFRAIHGEADAMAGLVVDVYDTTAVAVFDGVGAEALWGPRMKQVAAGLGDAGITLERMWIKVRRKKGQGRSVFGSRPPASIEVAEWSTRYGADVRRGQKTGMFLDQRDNRRRVGALAMGRRVLNLFCYTGGFSVAAAQGGATGVTSVDLSAPAVAAAEQNFRLSGLDPKGHEFIAADCLDTMAALAKSGRRYDLVIVDPPSYAPSERVKERALVAYETLNAKAIGLVEHGGVLVTCTCSSHVSEAEFVEVVARAGAKARRDVSVFEITTAGSDHPRLPGFPEGHYLTAVFAVVR